ncbi:MAG: tetratricopeptide repeat protein [Deltaproteobacteria bacterium]|nr:MAG: tetratricopeptide repeat protein [Deltaproteobacteria bacterium]
MRLRVLIALLMVLAGCSSSNYKKAEELRVQDDNEAAVKLYQKAVKSYPGNPWGRSNLSILYSALGKYDLASMEGRSSDLPEAHLNLGIIYFAQGEEDQAVSECKKAIELNPDFAEAHYNLGFIYTYQGKYEQAVIELKRAIEIRPYYADAYAALGFVYFNQKKYKQAVEELNQALKFNPNSAETHYLLGTIYENIRRYRSAFSEYKKALKYNRRFAEAYFSIAGIYERFRRYDRAIKLYQVSIKLERNYAEAYHKVGWLYATIPDERYKNPRRAIAFSSRAVKLTNWKSPVFINTLAEAFYSKGDFDNAIKCAERAIKLRPDNISYYRQQLAKFQDAKNRQWVR